MPNLIIPTPLQSYTSGESTISLPGETVAELLEAVVERHPKLNRFLFGNDGQLQPFVNLFLNEINVIQLQGLETPLAEEDTILIIPFIAGG